MIPFAGYLKIGLAVAAVIAIAALGRAIYTAGYNGKAAEATNIESEKTDAANRSDDAARRCSFDPACRLSDDGWRRD